MTPILEVLQHRARLYGQIRQYFATQQSLEVDLPLLQRLDHPHVVDGLPPIAIGASQYRLAQCADVQLVRVLEHYQVPLYQFRHVFAEPQHKTHVEEVVLCWRAPHSSMQHLAEQMTALLTVLFEQPLTPEPVHYAAAVARRLQVDVESATCAQLKDAARRLGVYVDHGADRLAWQQSLFYQFVEPTIGLNNVVYLSDCPPFAGQPCATVLVYLEGLVIGTMGVHTGQPIGHIMLDRVLMIMESTRRLARVQWID